MRYQSLFLLANLHTGMRREYASEGVRFEFDETPPLFQDDAVAQRLWKQLHDPLRQAGILTDLDLPAFETLCSLYSRMKREKGSMAYAELCTKFTILAKQFGLTPAARKTMKVDLMKDADEDEF